MLAETNNVTNYAQTGGPHNQFAQTGGPHNQFVGPPAGNSDVNTVMNAAMADNSFVLIYKDKNNAVQTAKFKTESDLYKWISEQGWQSGWGFLTTWQGILAVAAAGLAGWAIGEYLLD